MNKPPPQTGEKVDLEHLTWGSVSKGRLEAAYKSHQNVPIKLLRLGKSLPADLFQPMLSQKQKQVVMVRLFSAGDIWDQDCLDRLKRNRITSLFFARADGQAFLAYFNQQAREVLEDPTRPLAEKADVLYSTSRQILEQAMNDERLGENVEMGRRHIEQVTKLVVGTPKCLEVLGRILVLDYSLYTHCVNVSLLMVGYCSFINLEAEEITALGTGALFHDIGKRELPENLLSKPGSLTVDEWRLMRVHPAQGYEMLRCDTFLPPDALRMVYQHHENLDGSGYPRALRGEKIAPASRLLRIVDSYDAITSTRCYSKARDPFAAINIMRREMAGALSENLFKTFVLFLGQTGEGRGTPANPPAGQFRVPRLKGPGEKGAAN